MSEIDAVHGSTKAAALPKPGRMLSDQQHAHKEQQETDDIRL